MPTIVPVLLANSYGDNIWPVNTNKQPKQFLKLLSQEETLFQSAARRSLMLAKPSNVITITNVNFAATTYKQLKSINHNLTKNIIIEPHFRNTAASIKLAVKHAMKYYKDAILWIIPCDQFISDPFVLKSAVESSIVAASKGKIVTYGIIPSANNSNYNYIVGGDKLCYHKYFHTVRFFMKKPSQDKLKWAFNQSNTFWNSGIFLFSANTISDLFKTKGGVMCETAKKAYDLAENNAIGIQPNHYLYQALPAMPFENIVAHDLEKLLVLPVKVGWSDTSSWKNLWEISQRDKSASPPLVKFLDKISKAA